MGVHQASYVYVGPADGLSMCGFLPTIGMVLAGGIYGSDFEFALREVMGCFVGVDRPPFALCPERASRVIRDHVDYSVRCEGNAMQLESDIGVAVRVEAVQDHFGWRIDLLFNSAENARSLAEELARFQADRDFYQLSAS